MEFPPKYDAQGKLTGPGLSMVIRIEPNGPVCEDDGGWAVASLPAPDLLTAVREQLGLELVSKKIPFDVLVIDSVDLVPTEN